MKKLKLFLALTLILATLLTVACSGTAATTTAAVTTKAATTAATTTAAATTAAATTAATTTATTTVATTTIATTAADAIKIGVQADLKGRIIGVQLGTVGDTLATDKLAAKEVQRFTQYVDAISALKQKKVDCIVMDADTGAAYVKLNTDLAVLDVGFDAEAYAMAVQKTGQDVLLAAINDTIAALKADGSIVKFKEAHAAQTGKAPDFNKGAAGGKLVVGTEPGFAPYEYMQGKVVVGVDIDIMAAVAKKMNKELVIESINFDGLIPALKSKKIQVIAAGMTVTEERKVNVTFSNPYTDAKQIVVIRKTSQK
jgi:polar amino acid transport system substrate-binding protein